MILNKTRIKVCNKCRAKGKNDKIKTYCFMRHSPYYDYESFYLCDNCFEKLDKILIKFLEPTSNETQEEQAERFDNGLVSESDLLFKQDKKGICWFCGTDIIKDENYKHEGFYFCSDKCIMKYNKCERERTEKAEQESQDEQEQADKNISAIFSTKNLKELEKEGIF